MKKLICLFLGFVSFAFAFGSGALSAETLEKLKAEKKLQNIFQGKAEKNLSLFPDTELAKTSMLAWDSDEPPVLAMENLFYVEKEFLASNSSDSENCDTSIDAVSKVLRSVSKMKGMEYYSNSSKKWETLYKQSHLIKSPTDKTPMPDDTEGSADGKEFFCLQEDNSFGDCVYTVKFRQTEKEVSVCFSNVANVKYGPIVAVKPGNLKISIVISDEGSYYLVYMLVQAKYPNISLFEKRLNRSFNARLDAIYKWFTLSF